MVLDLFNRRVATPPDRPSGGGAVQGMKSFGEKIKSFFTR